MSTTPDPPVVDEPTPAPDWDPDTGPADLGDPNQDEQEVPR